MAKGGMINPLNIKLCAVLERALNYIHSRNTKVIATSIINPMWIGHALIKDGLPLLNKTMVKFFPSSWQVQGECLLYDIRNRTPKSAATAAILFNYDHTAYSVSLYAHLAMGIACKCSMISNPPAKVTIAECMKIITFHALAIFMSDIWLLIQNHVEKSTQALVNHPDPMIASHAQ